MIKNFVGYLFILFFASAIFSIGADAQVRRDNLTYEEIEMIRDEQLLDGRMEIYVKAIDRRLTVLQNTASTRAEEIKKDSEKWGELPKGTRAELLSDIEKILDESINKIEDVSDRDAKNDLIPYSIHVLADAVKRFAPEFEKLKDATTDSREIGLINNALDSCEQVLEAASKIPKPTKKPKREKMLPRAT